MNIAKHKVPVVLFVFNRPTQLKETLECLKDNYIDLLYVFADGPRDKSDKEGVTQVRKLIDEIKWVKTKKFYSNQNKGLSQSIQYGLGEVFKHHDAAIIIEDDVCVAPKFYDFMCKTLDTYQNDSKIAGTTGLRYPFSRKNLDSFTGDVFLAPRFSSWGWATWKDRWDEINFDSNYLIKEVDQLPASKKLMGGEDLAGSLEAVKKGELSGCWDFYFYLNMVICNQYFVWPKHNLVRNNDIGGGTHFSAEKPKWNLSWEEPDKKSFILPEKLLPNDMIINDFLKFFKQPSNERKAKMKQHIKSTINKLGFDIKKIPKESTDPKDYSTVGSQEVPCQKESYFYALNNFIKEGDRVLDVGMGIGYGMNLLSIKAKEVYAVDVDKGAVENCSKSVLGKNPKVKELKLYDGYNLPYKDKFFDVVTCVDVVEHVEDYDKFIDELLRVAKRAVVFATPNRRPEYTNPDGTPTNHWHLREWSFAEFDKIAKSHSKKVKWAFLDGPWVGPFKTSYKVNKDTMVLLSVLIKD